MLPTGHKHKMKTLYLRLLLSYLPLMVAAVMVTTFTLAWATSRYVSGEMDKLHKQTLDKSAEVLDGRLEAIMNAMFQLACSKSVKALAGIGTSPSGQEVFTLYETTQLLSMAMACDPMIGDMYLYVPGARGVITAQSKRDPGCYIASAYPGRDPDAVLSAITGCRQRGYFVSSGPGGPLVTLVSSIPLVSADPRVFLCTLLDPDAVRAIPDILRSDDENLLMADGTGTIVFAYNANNGDLAGTALDDLMGKGSVNVYEMPSSQLDMTYVYTAAEPYIRPHLMRICLYALLIFVLAAAAVAAVVTALSRRIYRPISATLDLIKNRPLPEPTDSDITLIRRNIEALIRHNGRLDEYVRTVEPYVVDRILSKVLLEDIGAHEAAVILEELGIRFGRDHVMVCLLRIADYPHLKKEYSEALLTDIKSRLARDLRRTLIPIADAFTIIEGCRMALVLNFDDPDGRFDGELRERLAAAQRQALQDHGVTLGIVTGARSPRLPGDDPAPLIGALQQSYGAACGAMERLFFLEEKRVILGAGDPHEPPVNRFCLPPEAEQEIGRFLFLGQSDEAVGRMRELVEQNIALNRGHYANTRQLLNDLLSVALKTLLSHQADLGSLFESRTQPLEECRACDTLGEAVDCIAGAYRTVGRYFAACAVPWPMSREQVVEYIEGHYVRDVGLQDIADHFNISPGYFNSVFKDMMNTTFHEYLTGYRIERAKQFMASGHFSMKEIAGRVGFNGYRTFIRCFRKCAHCTPQEYRQRAISGRP